MTDRLRILAVDICGTLYDTNTTAGLVLFHHSRCGNRRRHNLLNAMTRRGGALRFALVTISKVTGLDLHRLIVLQSLRGERPATLEASAKRFVEDHLPDRSIRPTLARLEAMRAGGWEPILTSAAIDPVVSEIANQLKLRHVASQLRVRNGRLTGRMNIDLTGQKKTALETLIGCPLSDTDFAVITDNRTDRDLVLSAAPAILISNGKPRKWMKALDAEIICP